MKINTTRQSLLDALLVVSRAVSARAALQALSGILITADGEARLRATDMEVGLEVGLGIGLGVNSLLGLRIGFRIALARCRRDFLNLFTTGLFFLDRPFFSIS